MARKVWIAFSVLLGAIFFALSAFLEYDVSARPPRQGLANELNLSLSDLQQTISAGSSRIFAGLCFVAAAILFSAADRSSKDKPGAESADGPDRPRD